MIHACLPPAEGAAPRPLPFYLAMEEFLARHFTGEYFFMWQVRPTVICGRNQILEAEVNLPYCAEHGIEVYRRKSGGGCVYADMNNVMFSHITSCRSVATTFADFTGRVAAMLRSLGIAEAHTTGRNDILIADRKVSGYAFYHIGVTDRLTHTAESRAIVHGTMLLDADLPAMTAALTPSAAKLEAKGVASVRSRVTTVREHLPITLEEFKAAAVGTLCSSQMTLTRADIAEIERMALAYYAPQWLEGVSTTRRRLRPATPHRIEGVGELIVELTVGHTHQPVIERLDLAGDFFLLADMDRRLLAPLRGCPLHRPTLVGLLERIRLHEIIPNLAPHQLADLILNAAPTAQMP